jgi:hypothetical protein
MEEEGGPGSHREPQCLQVGQEHLQPVPDSAQQFSRGFCSLPAAGWYVGKEVQLEQADRSIIHREYFALYPPYN